MRIAFVSPNREHLPDPVLPLGVLYMMSVAGEQHERTLIDLCFEPEPLQFLADRLREFRPDLVAVSMRNIQNADYTDTGTTLGYYDQVVGTIRECTAAPVAMGGGGFSVIPQELMQRYALMPCGASMGDGYGPMLVARSPIAADPGALAAKTIAVPGTLTSAFLDLQLFLGREFAYEVVPFDAILDHVEGGRADLGLVIHEGQLTYAAQGLHKILDLCC